MTKLLTRTEAAAMLRISLPTLDQARMDGQISYIQAKPNGKVWIPESEIDKFLEKSMTRSIPEIVRNTIRKPRSN